MKRILSLSLTMAAGLLFTPGCDLYFHDGGDDFDGGGCVQPDDIPPEVAGVRDPYTGQCTWLGGGNCDPDCGPCPVPATEAEPDVSWGACYSECTGLGEQACLDAPGCRGAYYSAGGPEPLPPGGSPSQDVFFECWATDRQGPIEGGECTGLDAWQCSRHDDCVAIHALECEGNIDGPCSLGVFNQCAPEPGTETGCYSDADCASGEVCTAGEECMPPPGCDDGEACPAVCYGRCVPDSDPPPPPPPPAACADIYDEMACIARADCAPYYEGVDCTCSADGCTCADWAFSACQDADKAVPPTPPVPW